MKTSISWRAYHSPLAVKEMKADSISNSDISFRWLNKCGTISVRRVLSVPRNGWVEKIQLLYSNEVKHFFNLQKNLMIIFQIYFSTSSSYALRFSQGITDFKSLSASADFLVSRRGWANISVCWYYTFTDLLHWYWCSSWSLFILKIKMSFRDFKDWDWGSSEFWLLRTAA